MKVTLINYTPDPQAMDLLLYTKETRLTQGEETRAKIAAMSAEEKREGLKYMANTIPSSWEFLDYTFEITDVTRAFTHQFVRTRTGSYAQQTMRLLDKKGFTYETGPSIRSDRDMQTEYDTGMATIQEIYDHLIQDGAVGSRLK